MQRFTAHIVVYLILTGFFFGFSFVNKSFAAYTFDCSAGFLDQGSCNTNNPPNILGYSSGKGVCDFMANFYSSPGKTVTASCTDYCFAGVGPFVYEGSCPVTQANGMCQPRPGPYMAPEYLSRSCSTSATEAGNAGYCCNYTIAPIPTNTPTPTPTP
ncbi:MAG: hypothetical protein US55_C0058G0001, partial [Candidatus Levybacteria bacterium GW2011_GWC2_37_7]